MCNYFSSRSRYLGLIGLIGLLLLVGCSQQPQNLVQAPDVTIAALDVGVYTAESGNYTEVSSGKVISQTDQLNAMLSDANKADDDFLKMVQSVGGFAKYSDLLDTESISKLRVLHNKYGVGFTTKPPSGDAPSVGLSPQAIGQCVPFFPQADRNRVHLLREWAQTVFIDASGRPGWAKKKWLVPHRPPVSKRLSCQTIVGNYGPSPATDVGGHLIAAMLNGYGGRANMVPQNGSFNNGQWKSAEYTARRCVGRTPTSLIVTPKYNNSSTVRPVQMWMDIFVPKRFGGYFTPKLVLANSVGGGSGNRGQLAVEGWAKILRPYCG